MIVDCFQDQNLKNSEMYCLVTAVLEITECFCGIHAKIVYTREAADLCLDTLT